MMTKKIKIILISAVLALFICFVILCVAVGKKNVTIREIKRENKELTAMVDSLKKVNERLGNQDCITIETTFEISNKNIFSVNTTQANQISRYCTELTRKEVLAAIDSIRNNRELIIK